MFMAVLNIRHSYAPGRLGAGAEQRRHDRDGRGVLGAARPEHARPRRTMTTAADRWCSASAPRSASPRRRWCSIPALRRTGFHWQWRFRARPERGRPDARGRHARRLGARLRRGQPDRRHGDRSGRHRQRRRSPSSPTPTCSFQMPYGILVVSLLTALMPRLSRAAARGEHDDGDRRPRRSAPGCRRSRCVPITARPDRARASR